MRTFIALATLWAPPMLVGCADPVDASFVDRERTIEALRITAQDLADGEIELELTDDVVFVVEADVNLDQVWIVAPDGVARRVSAVVGATIADEPTALGTRAAVDEWLADTEDMRMPGGCWWVLEETGWVRYCIA